MGITERKNRDKQDLKQRILDAAKLLFTKHGYEATSIRKIANVIEFSPTTIYLYYRDKNDILYALHQEGFKMLGTSFIDLGKISNPFERFKEMGRTYLKFALDHSDFYELMFIMKEPIQWLDEDACASDKWQEGINAFDSLHNTIIDCQKEGYFKDQDSKLFSLFVWSTVHGLCSLSLHGHFEQVVKGKKLDIHPDKILESAFENFLDLIDRLK
ncbi:TetR/AcrR family transcriptional regulator [Albibacterium bauzanense]|uniref:TetR family transcriptional regulator n=1 Tax=Albibacterium bauzanense TaxID=653929 RepID=A0A4R1M0M8_9SPHI|nr:TetR/AcrR family transcriptional regulator [Albibacterium bauzanense]TCK84762.1 TetR family transcriptional regulator [Albibacterium bauzanense]